jgi:hypothetical protein
MRHQIKENEMGDRANVAVKSGEDIVYLYTHWTGSELPALLQEALRRGISRWDDPAYLARVIFCEMVKGAEKGVTGYGISASVQDGEDRVIVVDTDAQTVTIRNHPQLSFADYAKHGAVW